MFTTGYMDRRTVWEVLPNSHLIKRQQRNLEVTDCEVSCIYTYGNNLSHVRELPTSQQYILLRLKAGIEGGEVSIDVFIESQNKDSCSITDGSRRKSVI